MSALLRIFTREFGQNSVPDTVLRQEVSVRRLYLDPCYNSRATVIMGQTPAHRMEIILLELIPVHFPRVERYTGSLHFASESVPLWSANIQHARLIDNAQTSERMRLDVVPNSFQCFPPHDKRVRIHIEDIRQTGLNHQTPQLDARVRCYMGRDRYQRIAAVDLSNPTLKPPGNASILIPLPNFDVLLGPDLIVHLRAREVRLTS